MKVALVYTSTTPELIELVEKLVKEALPQGTEIASYQDPSILAEVRDTGYVTVPPAARLVVCKVATTPILVPNLAASRHISSSIRTMGIPVYLAKLCAESATSPTVEQIFKIASAPSVIAFVYIPTKRAAGGTVT